MKEEPIRLKVGGEWRYQKTMCFEFGGGQTIIDAAVKHNHEELLLRIRNKDFFACEARYHPACRKHFINSPTYWRSTSDINVKNQSDLEESHRAAFQNVVDAVETNIIKNHDIIRLSELRDLHTSGLEGSGFENNDYRADKLKHKLETFIQFWELNLASLKFSSNQDIFNHSSYTIVIFQHDKL